MSREPHPLRGRRVRLDGLNPADFWPVTASPEQPFIVEDWWSNLHPGPWAASIDNPVCFLYYLRTVRPDSTIPDDDQVVYGHIGREAMLVHQSEIGVPMGD